MVLPAAHPALALGILLQAAASAAAPPPPAAPFDCSWIYHPPTDARRKFEVVYYSFIDNGGFFACSSDRACKGWMGGAAMEITFSARTRAQALGRSVDKYGVYRIVFEGRRGKLGMRPGCEDHWSLESRPGEYVRVEKLLGVTRLDPSGP